MHHDRDEPPLRPSNAAARRLQLGLEDGITAFTAELDEDLVDVERAVTAGRQDLAVEVLEAHLARLERFSEQLKLVVAGASVEREAEAVVARALPSAGGRSRGRPPAPIGRSRARGVMAAACVILLAVAAIGIRPPTTDPLLAAATASEQALDAARDAASGTPDDLVTLSRRSAELRQVIADLDPLLLGDPAVRARLQVMLVDQQRALLALAPSLPEVADLLVELEELARSLDLTLAPRPALDLDVDDLELPLQIPDSAMPDPGVVDDGLPSTEAVPPPELQLPIPTPEAVPTPDEEDAAAEEAPEQGPPGAEEPEEASPDEPAEDQPAGDPPPQDPPADQTPDDDVAVPPVEDADPDAAPGPNQRPGLGDALQPSDAASADRLGALADDLGSS